ncbi:MAG: MerR family transcriptional regulator [Candidatus Nanopelagicales bacterium]
MDLSIQEVARLAGTTSRTLRHYDDIGLLTPSRVGSNGYRYYDQAGLLRLQRILLLRDLGLGLGPIAGALASADDSMALHTHLAWLRQEKSRLDRQIASVEATLESTEKGRPIMASAMFDGFDHSQYKEEVEQRWGKAAYADSDKWWRGLGKEGRAAFQDESAAIISGWIAAREAGRPADDPVVVELAERHVAWIAAGWGGKSPTAAAIRGLAEMYVSDERFAANYGGVDGAGYVRDALVAYADTHLAGASES